MLIIIVGMGVFIGVLHSLIKFGEAVRDNTHEIEREEKARQRRIYEAMEKQWAEADKRKKERIELSKQLEAVQYQMTLLERLDGFKSHNMNDEKEVKKALALEKQYNTLWTKERKLKDQLKALG